MTNNENPGFNLIELMIVIVILAVTISVAAVKYAYYIRRVEIVSAYSSAKAVEAAIIRTISNKDSPLSNSDKASFNLNFVAQKNSKYFASINVVDAANIPPDPALPDTVLAEINKSVPTSNIIAYAQYNLQPTCSLIANKPAKWFIIFYYLSSNDSTKQEISSTFIGVGAKLDCMPSTYQKTLCPETTYSKDGACVACTTLTGPAGSVQACSTSGDSSCLGGTIRSGNTCICGPNQYWNGSACTNCTSLTGPAGSVQACTTSSDSSCLGGTIKSGNTCSCGTNQNWNGSSCVTSCGANQYWNGSACIPCTILTGPSGIISPCSLGSDASCINGSIQVNNSCVCPSGSTFTNNYCINCTAGGANRYFSTITGSCEFCTGANYSTGSACLACTDGCSRCSPTTNNPPNNCIRCFPGYTLSNGICSCPTGSYSVPSTPASPQAQCRHCPQQGCTACTSLNNCIQCSSSYTLSNGRCIFNCPSPTVPSVNNNSCVTPPRICYAICSCCTRGPVGIRPTFNVITREDPTSGTTFRGDNCLSYCGYYGYTSSNNCISGSTSFFPNVYINCALPESPVSGPGVEYHSNPWN